MIIHIPTTLSDEKVKEFKRLYEKVYGEVLSDDEAKDTAIGLLRFVGTIVQTHPKFNLDDHRRS
jgi:hypothetical protein